MIETYLDFNPSVWSLQDHGGRKKKRTGGGGTWVAQAVERPTSAQVMVSRFVGSSPRIGLSADSAEPASFRSSVWLSLPLPH